MVAVTTRLQEKLDLIAMYLETCCTLSLCMVTNNIMSTDLYVGVIEKQKRL